MPDSAGRRDLTTRLGFEHPIIQAPMAGGPTTPALVAAASGAGALGSVAAAYLEPERLRQEIAEVRRLTDRPFAVNLFAGGATMGADDATPMLALIGRWHTTLGLPPPEPAAAPADRFDEQVEVLLEADVPIASFTFGIPGPEHIERMHARGMFLIGTATTVEEAERIEASGLHAVVAQGSEAGAHRATFAGRFEAAMVGTMALVPQVVDAVRIPVVASGGIMDGRGIVAAQALGASAVQMGTAFLLSDEAATPPVHRERIERAREDQTVVTRAFSGRPARGIRNEFLDQVESSGIPIPPFPLQNAMTRPMRAAAARQGHGEALSLWAGQGVRLARRGPAATLIESLVREMAAVRSRLCGE
jgi:nitronate monooxygenase